MSDCDPMFCGLLQDQQNEINELRQLVRDMHVLYAGKRPYTPAEIAAFFDARDSIEQRIDELGIEVSSGSKAVKS